MSDRATEFAAGEEPPGWQAQKSAATRALIVAATVRCLLESGYAATTSKAIAAKAGLSRGAMLHHFPAKADVIRATVEHLGRARLEALARAIAGVERADPGALHRILEASLALARQPPSIAAFELTVAVRTDCELARSVVPLDLNYRREWLERVRTALPAVAARAAQLEVALETARLAIEGRALLAPHADDIAANERLLRSLESLLRPILAATPA